MPKSGLLSECENEATIQYAQSPSGCSEATSVPMERAMTQLLQSTTKPDAFDTHESCRRGVKAVKCFSDDFFGCGKTKGHALLASVS